MGIPENINFVPEEWTLDLKSRSVLMVLSEQEMHNAHFEEVNPAHQMLLANLAPDAAITDAMLAQVSVLILEIRPEIPASISRFADVRATHPDLPVVAAIRDADVRLVRTLLKQGARDVVGLPLVQSELVQIVDELMQEIDAQRSGEVETGQLVSVLKSIGGVGATTVATHLASQLAGRDGNRNVCLIDLDLQFGDAASYLGITPQLSISDLLAAGSRIDGALLRSVATKTEAGLHVIAAPVDISPLEAANSDQILRIIELAREEYDHVILDLPTNWTNWTLSLVAQSDVVFLVAELSVASLRQAKRQLELLGNQKIGGGNLHVVANRIEKRLFRAIDLDSASQALHHPINYSIHNDYPLVRAAHDQGVLVNAIRAKSKIGRDIEDLLDEIPLVERPG
jgi:pilus assembly protein CpaE